MDTTMQDAMQCTPQYHNAYRANTPPFHDAHFNALHTTIHTTIHTTMPQCTMHHPFPPFPPFPPFHHIHMRPPTPAPPSPRHPVSSHLLSLVYTARQKVMFANFCADSDLMHNMHCGELKLVKLFMPIIVTTAKYIAIEPWKRDRQC